MTHWPAIDIAVILQKILLQWRRMTITGSSGSSRGAGRRRSLRDTNPAVPRDSDLMGAVTYALNEWEWVPWIFKGGDYDVDNNLIEPQQQLVSLLRQNSLFFGSPKGGETVAMYLSLVVSCRLNGVKVMEYISDILNRCASWNPITPLERYRDLLPDRWKPQMNGIEWQRLPDREPLLYRTLMCLAETDTSNQYLPKSISALLHKQILPSEAIKGHHYI